MLKGRDNTKGGCRRDVLVKIKQWVKTEITKRASNKMESGNQAKAEKVTQDQRMTSN